MSKYAKKTSLLATGHASSDDDVTLRVASGDNLLYLELVQRTVALVWFVLHQYVNVSTQFAMICCIQSP